jgi:HEAT repeat protein
MSSLNPILQEIASPDALTRENAAASAIAIGPDAARPLERLIESTTGAARAPAMYALSQIADPESAATFLRGIEDGEPRVRSYAAAGLVRIKHPQALDAAIATLNDAPDPLHNDMTPSVFALADIGMAAIPKILDAMDSADEMTRLRAQRALERIVMRRNGFVEGSGFSSPEVEDEFRQLWVSNGSYAYDADDKSRGTAIEQWREWFRRSGGTR